MNSSYYYCMSTFFPLTVKIIYEKESKDAPFVAYTPKLDISSCGPTEEKARENLKEAIELSLEGAAEDGTLRDLLLEAGFKLNREKRSLSSPQTFFFPWQFVLPPKLEKKLWLG